MENFYEILEVSEKASKEVIEKAYKALAKKYHPDANEENKKKEAEEKFKKISNAYEILIDDEKRKNFDKELQIEKMKNGPEVKYVYVPKDNVENRENNTQRRESESEYLANLEHQRQIEYQRQMEYEKQKAYQDAYVKSLKDRGYNVVYKKTFKEHLKNFIIIAIIILILVIIWFLPPTNHIIVEWYNGFPDIFKKIIELIINIFKGIFGIKEAVE